MQIIPIELPNFKLYNPATGELILDERIIRNV